MHSVIFNHIPPYHGVRHKQTVPPLDNDVIDALQLNKWAGYSVDTASVLKPVHKLANCKYLVVLQEYGRINPELNGDNFRSGMSLNNAAIINLETKKTEKRFKILAVNSDSISTPNVQTSVNGQDIGAAFLDGDLKRNVIKAAKKYLFNIHEASPANKPGSGAIKY